MRKRLPIAIGLLIAAIAAAGFAITANSDTEPRRATPAVTVSKAAPGSSVIARYRFGGRVGEFDRGTIAQVATAAGVVGVYAGTTGPANKPVPSVMLEFAGKKTFISEHAPKHLDDGAWHDMVLVLRPAVTGTAYALDIDGEIVLSGVAEGFTYSHPQEVKMSPHGDLAHWDGLIVSPPLPGQLG